MFGRGGEEADHVAAAGLAVEVVPGISSALAAPALAGIPVTDRRHAASFTVATGHRVGDRRFRVAAGASRDSTLIVLMASSTASDVATVLLDEGWLPGDRCAFVHAAGTPDQQQVVVDLVEVAERGCPFTSPTVMVVGPTIAPVDVPARLPGAASRLSPTR